MKLHFKQTIILVQLFVLSVPASWNARQSEIEISTPEQIKTEFEVVPCKNEDRLTAAKALFEKMGAPASDLSIVAMTNQRK